MQTVPNPSELIEEGKNKFGTYAELCRRTGLNKSTIKRIRKGTGKGRWHAATIGRLVKALNESVR